MAKFVIAGRSDCPRYARAELLADKLSASLPNFNVHKIVQSSSDWPSWLKDQCTNNDWSHSKGSPLVWRELIDRGGKGLYLGGLEEFADYCKHYYGITPDTTTELEAKIASENQSTLENNRLVAASVPRDDPLIVCITNSTSPIAYHLSEQIATGRVYGDKQKVALQLYDNSPEGTRELEGLKMELEDLASPLLTSVSVAMTLHEVFNSVNTAFILDYPYQGSEITAGPAIQSVVQRYHKYATSIDYSANKDVHIIVSGCHSNLGAAIIAKFAASIPRSKVIAAPCLVERQAKAILAQELHLNGSDINQVCVWGRTNGADTIVDVSHTRVRHFNGSIVGPDPFNLPITRCVFELKWVGEVLPSLIADRHASMTGYKVQQNVKAPLVQAIGLAELARRWEGGDGVWVPVGVVSGGGDEYYGIPEGVAFSLPAQSVNGEWVIAQGLTLTEDIKTGIAKQASSLKSELEGALKLISDTLNDH